MSRHRLTIDRIDYLIRKIVYLDKPGIGSLRVPADPKRTCHVHHRKDRCYLITRLRRRTVRRLAARRKSA